MKTIVITLISILSVAAVVTVIITAPLAKESPSNEGPRSEEKDSSQGYDSDKDLNIKATDIENDQEDDEKNPLIESIINKETPATESTKAPESSSDEAIEDIAQSTQEPSDETYEIVEDTSDDIDLSEEAEETLIVEEATEETSEEKPGETYEVAEETGATSENENDESGSDSNESGKPGTNQDADGLSLEDLIEELRAAGFDEETIANMIVAAESGGLYEVPEVDERAYLVTLGGNMFFNGNEQVYAAFSVSAVEPIITQSEDHIHIEERGGSISVYENIGGVFENDDTLNAQYMGILRTRYDRDDMVYVLIWDLDLEITVLYDRYGNLFEY